MSDEVDEMSAGSLGSRLLSMVAIVIAGLALWRFGEMAVVVQNLIVAQQSDNRRLDELEAARR
jgi:hypothetical protein